MSPDQLQELKLNGFLMGISFIVVVIVNAIMRKRHVSIRSTIGGRFKTGLIYGSIASLVAPSISVLIFGRLEFYQFAYIFSVCMIFGVSAFWVADTKHMNSAHSKRNSNLDDWNK